MHFINPVFVFTLVLATTTSAVPLNGRSIIPWQVKDYMEKRGHKLPTHNTGPLAVGCDLMNIKPPTTGGDKELVPPDAGLKLTRVVLGVGTQNYTCTGEATNEPLDTPVALGAKALLYDASCLAVNHPDLLRDLPGALVQVSEHTLFTVAALAESLWNPLTLIVGEHHFPEATTPTFDFSSTAVDEATGKGKIFFGKVEERVPAPEIASMGRTDESDKYANGAIDWLRLSVKEGTVGYKAGYRLVTAGGKPPSSCAAYPHGGTFEVPYATEYWFYDTASNETDTDNGEDDEGDEDEEHGEDDEWDNDDE